MTGLVDMDALGQAGLVRRGEATARDLVEEAVGRIEATEPRVNAVTHRWYDQALAEADAADPAAPFAGVPMLVKALDDCAGQPADLGSSWLAGRGRVATGDAVAVRRLRRAGFVILGQTSAPEFGLLSVSESRVHGITRNPWRTDLTSGGSSGGASAAVAAGMVPAAQGGDGGGSIRMPAAFCHLVGLKPSVGRISAGTTRPDRWGHSVPGVLTRTVRDTAAILDAVAGAGPGDRGGPPPFPGGGLLAALGRDPGPLRVGVLAHDPTGLSEVHTAVADAVRATAAVLERLGHRVEPDHPEALGDPRCLPMFFDALSVTVAQTVEVLAAELGGPPGPDDLDVVTRHWLDRGREMSAVDLADALDWQGALRARMAAWWAGGYDLLLCPVFAGPPKPVSWPWTEPGGVERSVSVLTFTAPFNTTGQPAVSVPASVTAAGEPIGVQLVAGYGREDLLVQIAGQLETEQPWRQLRPPVFAA